MSQSCGGWLTIRLRATSPAFIVCFGAFGLSSDWTSGAVAGGVTISLLPTLPGSTGRWSPNVAESLGRSCA